MKTLRVARHTSQLSSLTGFYTRFIGLDVLGEFHDHDGYNGVFLGKENLDWHLEFTASTEEPSHTSDADDMLAFYVDNAEELASMMEKANAFGLEIIKAQNPYWNRNGFMVKDPDGFNVVIAIKPTRSA